MKELSSSEENSQEEHISVSLTEVSSISKLLMNIFSLVEKKHKVLENKNRNFEERSQSFEQELNQSRMMINQWKTSCVQLENENQELKKRIQLNEQSLMEYKTNENALENDFKLLRKKILESEKENLSLEKKNADFENQISRLLNDQKIQQKTENAQVEFLSIEYEKKFKAKLEEILKLKAENQSLQSQLMKLKAELESHQDDLVKNRKKEFDNSLNAQRALEALIHAAPSVNGAESLPQPMANQEEKLALQELEHKLKKQKEFSQKNKSHKFDS